MKNNKLLIAILIVLLFIPAYIGIANFIHLSKSPVSFDSATSIVITDVAGLKYKEKSDSPVAKLFEDINKNAIKVDSLPNGLSSADYFIVTYVEGKRETDYRYYFSLHTNSVYYIDATGITYMVSEADAARFIETPYAQSLYENAYLPTLTNGENTLIPKDYEWAYETASGDNKFASTLALKADETATYISKSGLVFDFSREPATFDVLVKSESGETLYDGAYSSLAGAIDIKKHSTLNITMNATWLGSEENMSGGKASYEFILGIEAQPEFLLAVSGEKNAEYVKFEPGDVAFITAIGVKEPQKISFSASPAITHNGKEIKPVFFAEDGHSFAFLPTAYDTAAGEYTLTFGYEGINHTLKLTVEPKTFKGQTYEIKAATANATRSAATLETFANQVSEIVSGNFGTRYFTEDTFGTGVSKSSEEGNYQVMTGYGRPRTISSTKEVYNLDGVDYYRKNGAEVYAVMNGKVIYTGSTAYSGTMVAIDHGFGLISWYRNLEEYTVNVGDIVEAGATIAKSGSTGFTKGGSAFIGLSVYDVPVCAYDFIWGSGIIFK